MLNLQGVTYTHPNRDLLFADLDLHINKHDKIALIGNNGSGKSTLLKILSGNLKPSEGTVKADTEPYFVPQLFGQFNDSTIARALKVEDKLNALTGILNGDVSELNMTLLDDDWNIEERCKEALIYWGLKNWTSTKKSTH
jgi:ATPase subunit of ABC transporter with duplicated ATPase domains